MLKTPNVAIINDFAYIRNSKMKNTSLHIVFRRMILVLALFTMSSMPIMAQKAVKDSVQAETGKRSLFQTFTGYLDSLDFIRNQVVMNALPFLGTPYHFSGSKPGGFDCSGFTSFVFSMFNMALPHSAALQAQLGEIIDLKNAMKGDLLFFGYKNKYGQYRVSHVGIVYSNDGENFEMIHASSSEGVKIDCSKSDNWKNYWSKKLLFVKRVLE